MFIINDSKKLNNSWLYVTTSLDLGMHPGINQLYISPTQ